MRLYAAAALAALTALPAEAVGQVSASIVIPGGPVSGHIHIGRPPVRVVRARSRRDVVIVERYAPRVIIVERWHRGRGPKHQRHHRLDRRIVYYDRYDGRYYDRYRPGLLTIDVFVHDGRYYRYDRADWRDRRDRDDDRFDRDRRDRDRDGRLDRDRRRRGDDRWEDRR